MKRKFWLFLLLFIAGLLIVAAPDEGLPRLVEITPDHGPSWVDAIGLAISVGSWCLMLRQVWLRRRAIVLHLGFRYAMLLVFISGIGTGLTIASVKWDFHHWWLVGAAVSFVTMLVFIVLAFWFSANDAAARGQDN